MRSTVTGRHRLWDLSYHRLKAITTKSLFCLAPQISKSTRSRTVEPWVLYRRRALAIV